MKNLIILAIATLTFAACSSNQPTANNAPNTNSPANKPTNAAPAATAPVSNTNSSSLTTPEDAAKTDNATPKRVIFEKGATESVETVTLAPGATKQFVLGATGAQTLFITPGNTELTFRIVRGIAGELIKADDGVYSAQTKGNNGVRGDIVFEVKNPTKAEIKSKLTIAIEDFGD